jgi:hypothetical protein
VEYLIQAHIVDGYRPGVSPAVEEITPERQVCGVREDRIPPAPLAVESSHPLSVGWKKLIYTIF